MIDRRWALLALTLAACSASTPGRRSGLSPNQVASMPEGIRPAYELFTMRCSRCHTLARPLNSGITDPHHWRVYVGRMKHMPGSGISDRDADRILVFLDYYSEQVEAGQWSGGLKRAVQDAIAPEARPAEEPEEE